VPFYTPLRYPGGKRRLAPVVMRLLEANALGDVNYAEPYAGGAAIALALLLEEYASTVHINDLSRPVYAFWHTVLNNTQHLCRRIEDVKVTMREWHRQRAVYDRRDDADLADLGFATLFLNRTNRSGIISGGVIGGKHQAGKWALDVRFNKRDLVQRIRRIGRYKNRIKLYRMDALEFTNQVLPQLGPKTFLFYDPPYLESGKALYLNDYDLDGHRALASRVAQLEQPWVVTYDYPAVRADLYRTRHRLVYGLHYSAQERHKGREVMFLSDRLRLPSGWHSGTIQMARAGGDYPVYGRIESVEPYPPHPPGKPHGKSAAAKPPGLDAMAKLTKRLLAVPKKELDAKLAEHERRRRPIRARRKTLPL
jgi:DNA adenine methylase